MLPRLQAEERLNAINDGALAAGALKTHDARRMIQRLERAAKSPRRAADAKASPAALAAMGIGVVVDGAGPQGESLMAAPSQSNRGAADG